MLHLICAGLVNFLSVQPPVYRVPVIMAQKSRAIQRSEKWTELIKSVWNSQIKFKVYWVKSETYIRINIPEGSPPPPIPISTGPMERESSRVFIQGPSKVYQLSNINEPKILDGLLKLMDNPDRAWAAHIVIAKMLGISGLITSVDMISPQNWWELEGKTGKAKQAWIDYLKKIKPTMQWIPLGGHYRYERPEGFSNDLRS
jgi:hypothetical protein